MSPAEATALRDQPLPFARCPECDAPFYPFLRGQVQRRARKDASLLRADLPSLQAHRRLGNAVGAMTEPWLRKRLCMFRRIKGPGKGGFSIRYVTGKEVFWMILCGAELLAEERKPR
jgi:hypothetical protein